MKKAFLIFIVFLVLVAIFAFYRNNNPKVIISSLTKKDNISCADLTYKVYLFGVIPVAEAIFKAESVKKYDGRQVYYLNAGARPLKWVARVFAGKVILDSHVDYKTKNPILFRQRMNIPGKGIINKEVLYDSKNNIMTIAGVERQIFPNTQDPLSLIFNLKGMDFDRMRELEMNINTNQKNYILKGSVKTQELLIAQKKNKIIFIKAQIKRRDKNPYHQSHISMVLLKEGENIPVLLKVFASGIFISAKLVKISQ